MKKQLLLVGKLFLLLFLLSFVLSHGLLIPTLWLNKLPQVVTVFLSIIIQALPFVLIGVFGSALMQNLVTVKLVEKKLTQTPKIPGILLAIGAGFFFPVCDCGVIPVVRRMLLKKVPPYMAIAFLVTAPLVNPITVWATATAFGYNLPITLIRVGMAVLVGIIVALAVSKFFPSLDQLFTVKAIQEWETAPTVAVDSNHPEKGNQLSNTYEKPDTTANILSETSAVESETAIQQFETVNHHHHHRSRLADIFDHANEEFMEVVKFLIIGALIAALIQTIIPKQSLMMITQNPFLSIIVMMTLALSLSLCAEADAFVARSFTYHFPLGSVMAFMVFGQMLDIKNTVLLLKSFKLKAIIFIFGLCAMLVLIFCCLMNLLPFYQFMRGRF